MVIGKDKAPEELSPRLVRVRDAARFLAMCERKLWELTRLGEIPCIRNGRSVRYDLADLLDWIERMKGKHRG